MAGSLPNLTQPFQVSTSIQKTYEVTSAEAESLLKTLEKLETIKEPHFNLLRSYKGLHDPAVNVYLPTLFDLSFEQMKAKFCQKGQIKKLKSLFQGNTENQRLIQDSFEQKFNLLQSEVQVLKSIIEKLASHMHIVREGLVVSMKEKEETEKVMFQLCKETENLKLQILKSGKSHNEKFTTLNYKNSQLFEEIDQMKTKMSDSGNVTQQKSCDLVFSSLFQTFFRDWSKKVLESVCPENAPSRPDFSFLEEIKERPEKNLKNEPDSKIVTQNRVLNRLNDTVDQSTDPVIQDFISCSKNQTIRGWRLRNYLDNKFFFMDSTLADILSEKDLKIMLKHWKSPYWEKVTKGENIPKMQDSRHEDIWARTEVVSIIQTVFLTPFEVLTFINAVVGLSPRNSFKIILTVAYPKRIQYIWVKDGLVSPLIEYLQSRFSCVRKGQGNEYYLANETFNRLIRNCHRFLKEKQYFWRCFENAENDDGNSLNHEDWNDKVYV